MTQLELFAPARPYRIEPFRKYFPATDSCMIVTSSDGYGFGGRCGHKIGPGRCVNWAGEAVANCPRHAAGYTRSES